MLIKTLKDQTKNNIEKKFFELIKIYRDNVEKMKIKEDTGHRLFVIFLREFRALLKIVKVVAKSFNMNFETIEEKKKILNVTYLAFFYGVGPNSTRILKKSLKIQYIYYILKNFFLVS